MINVAKIQRWVMSMRYLPTQKWCETHDVARRHHHGVGLRAGGSSGNSRCGRHERSNGSYVFVAGSGATLTGLRLFTWVTRDTIIIDTLPTGRAVATAAPQRTRVASVAFGTATSSTKRISFGATTTL